MTLPTPRPYYEVVLNESTTSIAASPVVSSAVSPVSGYLQRVIAASGGTTTGTITVAVAINGGSDICGSALTIAAGSGFVPSTFTFPLTGANAIFVNEGDFISFTPSGGTGSTIPGAFVAAIRALT